MADFLPPVVLQFTGNVAEMVAAIDEAASALGRLGAVARDVADEVDAAMAVMEAAAVEAGAAMEEMAAATEEAMAAVGDATTAAADGMSALSGAGDAGAVALDDLAASMDALTAATDAAAAATDANTAALDANTAAARANTGSTRAAAAQVRDSGGAYDTVKGAIDGVVGKLQEVAKWGALAAAGIGVAAVDMASKFDQEMELVHTQAGASQAEVDQLKQKVLALAPTVGMGPEALAEGLYHVESAGFRSAEAMDILQSAAKLTAIGLGDMETTSQALIGVMAAGLPDVKNAADAAAYLNTTVGIGDMRMSKLAASIATGVLPSFKSAGLGMKDYSAALATLTDNVTPADEAATRLRMTISLMAAPSKKAASALESIGMTQSQLAMDLRQPDGLLVAVEDLKKHLGSLNTDAEKTAANKALSDAFGGGKTSGAILTLIGETDRLKSKYDALGTAASRAAAAQDAWRSQQQQFAQQIKDIRAQLEVWGIELGNKLIPLIEKFASGLKNKFTEIFNALKSSHVFDDLAQIWDKLSGPAAEKLKKSFDDVVKAITGHKAEIREVADALATGFMIVARDVLPRVISGIGVLIRIAATAVDAFNLMSRDVVGALSAILHAAVDAFGWVPGLGDKLRHASAQVDAFKDQMNHTLDQIHHDIPINLDITTSFSTKAAAQIVGPTGIPTHRAIPNMDVGGWVPGGPGEPVPIIAHGGEYVLSRDMLAAMRANSGYSSPPVGGPTVPMGRGTPDQPIVVQANLYLDGKLLHQALVGVSQRYKARTGTTGLT